MGKAMAFIGFVVAAIVTVGALKGISSGNPQQVPTYVNNEFAEMGLSVPQQSAGGGRYPVPYQSVPQPGDLPGDPLLGR